MNTTHAAFLFFADDWGRHPSSAQYLAREFAKFYPVAWVNTIGMRCPRMDGYTLRRGMEKVIQWLRPARFVRKPNDVHVLNPVQIPDWRSPYSRRINCGLIARDLTKYLHERKRRVIGISTLPLPWEWQHNLAVDAWVYYCVDNFAEWPGLDGSLLRADEEHFIRLARLIVAVSEVLCQHISSMGRASYLLPHGIDLECWTNGQILGKKVNYDIPHPCVMWWGLIDERIDWDWINYASRALPDFHFIFVGRMLYVPPAILRTKNVHLMGHVDPCKLPALSRSADVLMMPYIDAPVTRAMQPLKMLEYLASGRPIVARRLPALEKWRGLVSLVADKYAFANAIEQARAQAASLEERTERLQYLRSHTWEAKAQQFLCWLRQHGLIQ
ncbi:Putative teichuronic acid biosynthesis glycosyltransferase TuaH [bacterium HR36]|nr:Putative teichuronic acid biosynthesis glycosyltransferase TuaH [bacterium HR36]